MTYSILSKENPVFLIFRSKNKESPYIQAYTIQDVPRGKVNILEGHSIGHSKQKSVYVSYSERFPRQTYFTAQFQNCW
jgi:hypothetical protein